MKSETHLFSDLDHSISMDLQTINHFIENLPPPTVVDEEQEVFFNHLEDDHPRLLQNEEFHRHSKLGIVRRLPIYLR